MHQKALKRIEEHEKVQKLLHQGLLVEAIETAQKALLDHGRHVGLLCDLAACQYEIGMFRECEATTQTLQNEFSECKDLLSSASRFKTSVFLSKLLEEQGALKEALASLSSARPFAKNPSDVQFLEVQELRLLSYLGEMKELRKKHLGFSSTQPHDYFHKVETLHGLMWAEWALFGFAHALRRWESFLFISLHPCDRRLIHRDFLEIALLEQQPHHPSVGRAIAELRTADPSSFDVILMDLASGKGIRNDFLHCEDMSTMQKIRSSILEIRYEKDQVYLSELVKKYVHRLKTLPKGASSLLLKWFPQIDIDSFKLCKRTNSAIVGGVEVLLSPAQFMLMECFVDETARSIEALAQALWNENSNGSHYDRIRMTVYKLNTVLEDACGFKPLKIRKDSVTSALSVTMT